MKNGYEIYDTTHVAVDAYEDTPVHTCPDHQAQMEELEAEIAKIGGPNVQWDYDHYFTQGVYTRQMRMPKGCVCTGQIHRRSTTNIIASGTVLVKSDEGQYEITGPYTFISGPGVKKALICLTDVVWITVHPWDGSTTNIKEIVEGLIIPRDALEHQGED